MLALFLVTALVVCIAETGGRAQLLAAALSVRFDRLLPVVAGLACAALFNLSLSTIVGHSMQGMLAPAPQRLFESLAFFYAAICMLLPRLRVDLLSKWTSGPFMTAFAGLAVLMLGDKTQFLVAVGAAREGQQWVALAGGLTGMLVALIPPVVLGPDIVSTWPLDKIRRAGGWLFVLVGTAWAVMALVPAA